MATQTKATPLKRLAAILTVLLWMLVPAGCRPITAEGSLSVAPIAETAEDAAAAPELDSTTQALVDSVIAQVVAQFGVDAGSLQLVSVEAVEWPDASLGCPEPDMMYAQVVTPGYRVVLDAQGQTIELHTDAQQPPQVVTCAP
jgi:hypothetical protein